MSVMRRAAIGLWSLLLLVSIAAASTGQNSPTSEAQKLEGASPTSLASSFVDSIHAPAKEFVTIQGGAHFAVFMKSSAFLDQLVSRVLPRAVR
jgi:hypothetical protein